MVPPSPPTATWPIKEVPRFRQPVVIPLAPDVDTLYETESPVHAMFMPSPEQEDADLTSGDDAGVDDAGVDEVAADVVLEDATGAGLLFTTTSSLVSTGAATGAALVVVLGLGLAFAGGLSFGLYSTAILPSGVSVSIT